MTEPSKMNIFDAFLDQPNTKKRSAGIVQDFGEESG